MKKIRIEGTYDCTPEQYWEMLLDHSLRTERELKGCGAKSFKILQESWDGDVHHQTAEIVENVDAPKPVRKVFGETVRIEETSIWERGSDTVKLSYKPDVMGDRVTMVGQLVCKPRGEAQCHIEVDLEITAKIMIVGSIVEKLVSKELPNRQEKDRVYYNAHQAPK